MRTPETSIILVGLMGCGKSTIGRRLARRFKWEFVDTDAMVAEAAGCSIADIFAGAGEAEFRRLEAEAIGALADRPIHRVVSVGGGALIREGNLEMLRTIGRLVYLQVSPRELAARIGPSSTRPLLAGRADRAGALAELLAVREPLYLMADVTVPTDGFTVRQSTEAVLRAVLDYERAQGG